MSHKNVTKVSMIMVSGFSVLAVNGYWRLASGCWSYAPDLWLLISVIGAQVTKSAIHPKNFGLSDQQPATRSQ